MKICLYDPGIENNYGFTSANLGDLIIQEAVERELNSIFKNSEITKISTHVFPEQQHINLIKDCELAFVGGTNLLSSKMNKFKKWKFSLKKQLSLSKSILLGVTWQNYQEKPNFYTSFLLKNMLSGKFIHSVRDNYAKKQLELAGIKNVVNTGCPTMWPIANMNLEKVPVNKSDNALVMLTDYAQQPDLDKKFLDLVFSQYKKVFVWPQGRDDEKYILDLTSSNHESLIMLEHSFPAFNEFLKSDINFDYIGTRLHGGIKCLLNNKRVLILEIDNRAKEIAKDTNLPTIERENINYINQWINSSQKIRIKLDCNAITLWKSQFSTFTF